MGRPAQLCARGWERRPELAEAVDWVTDSGMGVGAGLAIFSRWIHIVSACVAVGGVVFMRVLLPVGLSALDSTEQREQVLLRTRRVFKMFIHTAILLFLLSGIYNSVLTWAVYNTNPPVLHSLWGTHVLLALIAMAMLLYVLAGSRPPAAHGRWMAASLVVLLLAVAAASTLRWARQHVAPGAAPAQKAGNP